MVAAALQRGRALQAVYRNVSASAVSLCRGAAALKKRNDAVSALQGAAKDKSIFDDSDEETAGPNPEQQLEAGAMFVKLSEDTTVILQIPKRKDSEVRIKLEEANIQALFSWLSEQDLTPQKPPEKPAKSKAQKRKGAPMDKKAAEVSPDS